ncbi:MAG: cadherin-like domain-containing protein, partial [Nocardioidaceae bacterium]|nr:cadherin-like domain-containing protein [Nocardioidaceae bacterium]
AAPPADPAAPPADNPAAPPAAAPPADQPADQPADPAPAQAQQAPVITTPISTVSGQPGGKTVIDLTEGATDANGDPLSVKEATVASPAHGTVTIGGATGSGGKGGSVSGAIFGGLRMADEPTSTVTYQADVGWRGVDTIEYVLTDGNGGEVAGTVDVRTPNADPKAANDAATATVTGGNGNGNGNNGNGNSGNGVGNQSTSATTTIDVLANDGDDNGDALELVEIVDKPAHGTAEIVDGKVVYRMTAGYEGTRDTFTYRISDGHGGKDVGAVEVTFEQAPKHDPKVEVSHGHQSGVGGVFTIPGVSDLREYEDVVVTVTGLPEAAEGRSTTLRISMTGVASPYFGPGYAWSACGSLITTMPVNGTVTHECTLSGDGEAAHVAFTAQAGATWTFDASIEPVGYEDSDAGNNSGSATGAGPEPTPEPTPTPTPTPSPSPTETPDVPQVPTPPTTPDVPQVPTPPTTPDVPQVPTPSSDLPSVPASPSGSADPGDVPDDETSQSEAGANAGGLTWKDFLKAIGIG